MKYFGLFFLGVTLSIPSSFANRSEKLKSDKEEAKVKEIKQQREEDISSAVGGSLGGQDQKEMTEKEKRDAEKSRQLYEHEGYYRRGL